MDCGTQCVKYLLFLFNFIFALSGIALIACGVVVKLHLEKYVPIADQPYLATPILLIVVGCVVFVISFFGCCGAAKENQCMIVTFAVLLSIIFIVELAAGIAAYVMKDKAVEALADEMKKTIKEYETKEAVREAWDVLQNNSHCCGINGPGDWDGKTPVSCHCTPGQSTCDAGIWNTGCKQAMIDLVNNNLQIIGGIGIGVAVIEILGIVFACCLACGIKNR